MSTANVSLPHAGGERRTASAWLESRPLWAGIAITAMWLAVLFIGLFGGDIVDYNGMPSMGQGSRVPSAVAIALFAMLATIPVAWWGFRGGRDTEQLRAALDEERRARMALAEDVAELQAKDR